MRTNIIIDDELHADFKYRCDRNNVAMSVAIRALMTRELERPTSATAPVPRRNRTQAEIAETERARAEREALVIGYLNRGGKSYREIGELTGASKAVVCRIAKSLSANAN